MRLFLRPNLVAVTVGIPAGLLLTFDSVRIFSGLLVGSAGSMAAGAVIAAAALGVVALAAGALPALRASNSDPTALLRSM